MVTTSVCFKPAASRQAATHKELFLVFVFAIHMHEAAYQKKRVPCMMIFLLLCCFFVSAVAMENWPTGENIAWCQPACKFGVDIGTGGCILTKGLFRVGILIA